MNLDVVIVSDAKNHALREYTLQAIKSAISNESAVKLNIIVLETQPAEYENCTVIRQNHPISYNRSLNIGAGAGKADFIAFCNNDLLFGKDWASSLLQAMDDYEAESASPYCPISHKVDRSPIQINSGVYAGYDIRRYFAGWCFILSRRLWEAIGRLDERLSFWCCDNATAEQVKRQGVRHILVTHSIVTHLSNGSQTLNTLQQAERQRLMHPEVRKFNRLYNQNLFGLGR